MMKIHGIETPEVLADKARLWMLGRRKQGFTARSLQAWAEVEAENGAMPRMRTRYYTLGWSMRFADRMISMWKKARLIVKRLRPNRGWVVCG